MQKNEIDAAAALLWERWQAAARLPDRLSALPETCRPSDRAEGYAIQAALADLNGYAVAGWKIAATSRAGQAHIGVDGPLAGRLFAPRVLSDGASVSLAGNRMLVAEAEFAFRFGADLPRRTQPYEVAEVLAAVATLHPAIEVPDSRYADFARVGAPQLIADDACADWFVLGAATSADWRALDLAQHEVEAWLNGALAARGSGANVLGDPRIALTWLVNELCRFGDGVQAGQFVTTGTCLTPVPLQPGDQIEARFGVLGALSVAFAKNLDGADG